MNIPKFKKNDLLKPNKKGISNYYILNYLFEVIVIDENVYPKNSKKLIKVKIIKGKAEGTAVNNYNTKRVEEILFVFEDAFDLIIPVQEDYSIY